MRVALIITARPSWAKAQTLVAALLKRGADVQIIACASALLERYGAVVNVIRQEYPDVPITEVWSTYEGANLITSAKETASLIGVLVDVLHRLRPSRVVVIADRHEVLGAAIAAAYLHLPVVHLQGGERTGSIDDSVRDSISQLATVHLVTTELSKHRVYALTGEWDCIHISGCPSIDLAKAALCEPMVTVRELGGSGDPIDLDEPFIVVLQHPVTDETEQAGAQMTTTLNACAFLGQLLVFWPGEDAGMEQTSKAIRVFSDTYVDHGMHTVRNLPPKRFLRLLTQAACVVGNSSAGIRECSYLGVPVVNVGSRQFGRERAKNVIDVPHDIEAIRTAVQKQMAHGPYLSSRLYGSGDAGERMAEVICAE